VTVQGGLDLPVVAENIYLDQQKFFILIPTSLQTQKILMSHLDGAFPQIRANNWLHQD
jgi:hypothetical protein